jgi:hypothetical protein
MREEKLDTQLHRYLGHYYEQSVKSPIPELWRNLLDLGESELPWWISTKSDIG